MIKRSLLLLLMLIPILLAVAVFKWIALPLLVFWLFSAVWPIFLIGFSKGDPIVKMKPNDRFHLQNIGFGFCGLLLFSLGVTCVGLFFFTIYEFYKTSQLDVFGIGLLAIILLMGSVCGYFGYVILRYLIWRIKTSEWK